MSEVKPRGYLEMCNFPEDLIDERTKCSSLDYNYDAYKDYSPRTKSFMEKFELDQGEVLVKTYTCALKKRFILQGRIYVTSKKICFYSVFNKSTVFFGKGTRVEIPFENITRIK